MRKTLSIGVALAFVLSFAACGDDSTGDNNSTVNCTDADGDGYGVGADCTGADCDDADVDCWEGTCCTVDCTDADGDGYGVGTGCTGADCDDADVDCWAGTCCPVVDCADADGDGYGNGADCLGLDCNDSDIDCWLGACCPGDCTDVDGDGYGVGTGCLGPDCDDADVNCNTGTCCPAGTGEVGEACSDVSQCTGITNGTAECLTSVGGMLNFPGGYCTGSGCTVGTACDNANGVCVDLFTVMQYCLVECTAASECRQSEGYDCAQLPQAPTTDPMYCMPPTGAP